MAPIFILLLGASFPKTNAGTMVGKPVSAIVDATVFFIEDSRNFLLDNPGFFSFVMTFFKNDYLYYSVGIKQADLSQPQYDVI
jgi:hypothetical protein